VNAVYNPDGLMTTMLTSCLGERRKIGGISEESSMSSYGASYYGEMYKRGGTVESVPHPTPPLPPPMIRTRSYTDRWKSGGVIAEDEEEESLQSPVWTNCYRETEDRTGMIYMRLEYRFLSRNCTLTVFRRFRGRGGGGGARVSLSNHRACILSSSSSRVRYNRLRDSSREQVIY